MLGLSLCWNQQTVLFGQARSIALYVLTFCSALTDCLTSIIFWVFVSYAPTPYMAALSAGESSSGIISSILIWIQQSGRPRDSPRYSITAYLMIISCLIPISAVAFFVLVRSLRNGYLEETTDWISRPSPSGTRRGSDFEDCAFHSEHEQLQHEDTTSGSLSQRWTTSLNKNQSILSIPDPETEMVQSNLCAASSKMKQYCSMGDTNGVHAHSMVINEDTLPHSNMTLTTNPLDVMHADHHRGANSSTSCSAPSSSSGITRDINNAVLNNVASGYWGFMMAMGVLSGVQNGMLPSILSFALVLHLSAYKCFRTVPRDVFRFFLCKLLLKQTASVRERCVHLECDHIQCVQSTLCCVTCCIFNTFGAAAIHMDQCCGMDYHCSLYTHSVTEESLSIWSITEW